MNYNPIELKDAEIHDYESAARIGGIFLAQLKGKGYLSNNVEPVRFDGGKCFTTTCELIPNRWEFIGPIEIWGYKS